MRIKAKSKDGIVTVKALAKHPMLSGQEAKKKKLPMNFITYIIAKVGDETVYEVTTSQFFSKDPYLKFSFKGDHKGKDITITWTDLSGKSKTSSAKIK